MINKYTRYYADIMISYLC